MRDARSIIRLPLMTEKGTKLRDAQNGYIFWVDPLANKIEIAHAVETIFKVQVRTVRTMNYMGKPKRLGRFEGRRINWKKAVVTLKKDYKIDIFEQVV